MMHPITRIVIVLLISTGSVISQNPVTLTVLLVICVVLLLFSSDIRQKRYVFVKHLKMLVAVILSLFFIQLIFNRHGQPIIDLSLLRITDQGLKTAIIVSLRLLTILFAGAWLWGMSVSDFIQAFRVIKMPEALAVMILMTLRFLPVLTEKIKQSRMQLITRGIDFSQLNFKNRITIYLRLIIPIMGWTMKDIRFQAIALDFRGFRNGLKHTKYKMKHLKLFDYILICSITILFLGSWSLF